MVWRRGEDISARIGRWGRQKGVEVKGKRVVEAAVKLGKVLRLLGFFKSVQMDEKVLGHPDEPFLNERCSQSLAFYAVVFLFLI